MSKKNESDEKNRVAKRRFSYVSDDVSRIANTMVTIASGSSLSKANTQPSQNLTFKFSSSGNSERDAVRAMKRDFIKIKNDLKKAVEEVG